MPPLEESNKDLVRRYLDAFNNRDEATLAELLSEEVVEHGIHRTLRGVDDVLEFLQSHFDVFPDYAGTTEAMVAEGDAVTVRYSVRGTHSGEYRDVEPTRQTVEWTGMAMYRIDDGRIAEIWVEENRLDLLEQLEVVEPPANLRI